MEMSNFAQEVCTAVGKELGKDYEIKIQKVQKNNGICRTGILVLAKGGNVAPTIYLEEFLAAYESGIPINRIALQIMGAYQRNTGKDSIDTEFFRSFGKVKDRICYRLVEKKRNETLLEEIPHMEFLDLAICFYYAYYSDVLGEGSILIYNSHMKMWDTSTEELFELARENTPRLFPWKCSTLGEILAGDARTEEEEGGSKTGLQVPLYDEIPMKILTNSKRSYGAVCILYPGVLEEVAERMGGDFYILPSSVHEVILLPYDGTFSEKSIKDMISEVNRTQVEPEEVLCDSLYYYNAGRKETRQL